MPMFPRGKNPPTLTCGSSRATQCYSSTYAFVMTLPSKYWNIFTISSVSCHTSSSIFFNFCTRSKLMCFDVTLRAESTACCTFWCTGLINHVMLFVHASNSKTLWVLYCCWVFNTVTCWCDFFISSALASFFANGNFFISFLIWFT